MEEEEKLCDDMETVGQFTYVCDSVRASEDVRLLLLSEQDVGGVSLESVVSCCMVEYLL